MFLLINSRDRVGLDVYGIFPYIGMVEDVRASGHYSFS